MVAEDDWRLFFAQQHLRGQTFVRKMWVPLNEDWDHSHCAGCMTKFSLYDDGESLREGYAVTADYKLGEDYEWVCPDCFEALKDNLDWKVLESPA